MCGFCMCGVIEIDKLASSEYLNINYEKVTVCNTDFYDGNGLES